MIIDCYKNITIEQAVAAYEHGGVAFECSGDYLAVTLGNE